MKTDDGVIHYKTCGAGSPILIINGGPGLDCNGFQHLAELLSDKHTTILFDQRGTGESALNKIDESTITMDLMVEDMEALRKHLDYDQWIVLGHSFGGFLGEYYACKYPNSITALILSSSGGIDLGLLQYFRENLQMHLSQNERDEFQYWDSLVNAENPTEEAKYNRAKCLASAYLYDKSYVPQVAARLAHGGNPEINSLVFKDLFDSHFDCREGLKDFSKPVLIIQGRQDPIGAGVAYEAHNALKTSTLVFINKSGHYSWLEQGDSFCAELYAFCASFEK
ncbi:MAG: alpha/beta hydrolase [Opitutales bacterium]|nr:alpha/beta hydrolase [Opitutales bacterium]